MADNGQDRQDATSERWRRDAVKFDRQYATRAASLAGVSRALAERLSRTADLILAMPGKPTVLDLGCGVGRLCLHLASNGIPCIGLDISTEAIAQAKQSAEEQELSSNVQFLECNLLELRQPPDADVWVALGVLDYFREPGRILEHLRAIPKFVCTIPRRGHPMNIPRFVFRTLIRGERFWTYRQREARALLEDAGFAPTRMSRLSTMWFVHNLGS